MKIGILSRNSKLYSTRRLVEAAKQRGHEVKVLDTLKCSISVEGRDPKLYFRSKRLSPYDAIIPRIGASITFFGCAVVRQFEQMGVFTLNNSHAITVSRDKLRAMQVLSRHDIGMPATEFAKSHSDIMPAIERLGGAPVIIKLIEGTQGIGVILADSNKIAEAIVETLHGVRQNVLVQKFVAESRGKDVRAFVVGDKVVAAMRRSATGGEYRSNVHRGGQTQPLQLEPEYEVTAVRAAQILGLRVAGVDMLEGKDGPQIMEVNSSPGLEGIEGATGINVAGVIIQHLEDQVLFPDIDLRQRLTLKSGYGVAEFQLAATSPLVGKSIQDTGLREQDVIVMNINRQGVSIPNPRGTRELMAGDQLLCFGKTLTLRGLVPVPKPHKGRKPSKKSKAKTNASDSAAQDD